MKILWTILIVVVVLFVACLLIALRMPSTFSARRSAEIGAPPDAVYAKFAVPRTWASWSAWTTRADSTLRYTYVGPDSGVGATMRFTSRRLGNGELRITKAVPGREVRYDLRLAGSDMAVHGDVTLEPSTAGTRVTWHDSGDMGGNVLMRLLVPVLDHSLMTAYDTSFAGLRRDLAAAR